MSARSKTPLLASIGTLEVTRSTSDLEQGLLHCPTMGTGAVLPLQEGEERVIRVIHREDGHTNEITIMRRRDGDDEFDGAGEPIEYIAVIVGTDDDPARPPWAWQRAPTLERIYQQVAESALNTPPLDGFRFWNAPDLEEFIHSM